MKRIISAGQAAGLLALAKAPRGQYVYPDGHTSALCNLVGGEIQLIDRIRIKNRWHYRLTPRGRDAVQTIEAETRCPNTRLS